MWHFNILSSVIGLMIGAWATIYIHHKSQRFSEPSLRYLLMFMLVNNLSILYFLLLRYFNLNLPCGQFQKFLTLLNQSVLVIYPFLLLGKAVYLMKTISFLREKILPKWFAAAMFSYTSFLILLTWLAEKIPPYFPKFATPDFFAELHYWSLQLLIVIWSIWPLIERSRPHNPDRKRAVKTFALIFIFHTFILLFQVFLQSRNLDKWSHVLSKFLILYTNLIPLVWFKLYYIPGAGSIEKIKGNKINMPFLQQKYVLSARELEILNLIIDGKSNKQIEDILFISLYTVRRHVYNLYRKMKVKSRHQLIHLVSILQQENP